ncbi:MAG: tetratricopeptide repeat protein [Candidatus Marinimicrobia bacterium]|nr:tetratricopeptide repeat protein [Candidatus Neomarinimicrobiota bacterium]
MNHNKLKPFLKATLGLASERCGAEFETLIADHRKSREKFLKNLWVEEESTSDVDRELVFREIDFDTIVNMATDYLNADELIRFLKDLADLSMRYGQLDKSREVLKRIIKDYSTTISQQLLGDINQMLGNTSLHQSDLDTALIYYKKAQDIHSASNDDRHFASALNSEGIIHAEKGNTQASLSCFKQAHSYAQSSQDKPLLIQTSMSLANLSHTLGNYQESLMHLQLTSALIATDDPDLLAKLNHNLGITHKALHNSRLSLKYFDKAIEYAEACGDYYLRSLSFLEKSEVLTRDGDLKEGTALLTTAFQAFSEYGDRLGMADAYKVFGSISGQRNTEKLAISFFNNSLRISKDSDNLLGIGETYTAMGDFYQSLGDTKQALASYVSAKENFETMKAEARIAEINKIINKLV